MGSHSARPTNAGPLSSACGDLEPATAKAAAAGESARVEAAHHIELVAKLVVRLTPDTDAAFSPGRRDDHAVDRRALDTVEDRRLVPLVDDAHRHQDRTGSQVERGARTLQQAPVEEGLLDLHRSGNRHATAFRDEGMFELDFGVELEAIVEAVREEDDEAVEVQDGAEAVVLGLHHVQVKLAVAADRGLLLPPHAPLLHAAQGVDFDAVLPGVGLLVVDLTRSQDHFRPVGPASASASVSVSVPASVPVLSASVSVSASVGFGGGWGVLRAGESCVPADQPDRQAPGHHQFPVSISHFRRLPLANENDLHLH